MMSIAVSNSYSPRLYRRARLGLLILALLGLMIFAAVQDMAGQCRTENPCLADRDGCIGDASGALGVGKTTRCELTVAGWLRIGLSEQAADILRRLGVPVSYI